MLNTESGANSPASMRKTRHLVNPPDHYVSCRSCKCLDKKRRERRHALLSGFSRFDLRPVTFATTGCFPPTSLWTINDVSCPKEKSLNIVYGANSVEYLQRLCEDYLHFQPAIPLSKGRKLSKREKGEGGRRGVN